MNVAREGATATTLHDGRVLVVGGRSVNIGPNLASAELYDPGTGAWSAVPDMLVPRIGHTATLLANGKVLVAGGEALVGAPTDSAELFDPSRNGWQTVPA